ncbi:uncharacterized protein IL334_006470 [Kwoniella shivajii]|uniref:Uncharacterized protein n=1 Tax=Kwoniella shivajii TaxID=564305 RepID=A0ABZ1D845_9TREE|nr:hypothetical protein IL334_006470 [Kwoniella shivajii]
MSLPHNGSTAPAITSPILAWPSRPTTRPSPSALSTPSSSFDDYSASYPSRQASSSTTPSSPTESRKNVSSSSKSNGKGKGKAINTPEPELRVYPSITFGDEITQDHNEEIEKRYGPPKNPLPPHQLGRIAQSFGIIIPNLPQHDPNTSPNPNLQRPSPSSPSSSSAISPTLLPNPRGRLSPLLSSQPPTRPTPFLLSVIPPLCLLSPNPAVSPEQSHQRNKKWRRGRLLPLQPTLGSMLVCIAREYGLPSTIGLGIYLVIPGSGRRQGSTSSAASTYSSEGDEPSGPQISSSTWSTLFSAHLMPTSSGGTNTRSSTPSQTPMKNSDSFSSESALQYPPSPLSLANLKSSSSHPSSLGHKPKPRSMSTDPPPGLTHSSHPSISSSSAILPPTLASVGTSFSISSTPNPIVGTIEFDIDLDEARWFENFHKSGRSGRHKRSLTADSGGNGIKELSLVNKVTDGRPRFLREMDTNRPSPERKYLRANDNDNVKSTIATFDEFADGEDDIDQEEMINDGIGLLKPEPLEDDLLASPINLAPEEKLVELDHSTRLKVQEILDKRGSGIVMAEQLDDLEKMMRQLSPREIRLTSPRLLTPRMAAKVANLTLPAVPKRTTSKATPSPLAGGFTSPNLTIDRESENSVPNSAKSNGTFGSTIHAPTLPESEEDTTKSVEQKGFAREDDVQPPKAAWPAVPHQSSPGSPTIHEYIARPQLPTPRTSQRNVSSPAAISTETLQRMQSEQEISTAPLVLSSEWIPRRPARPPSPKLEHQRTLSHTLSPELVDFLHRSPPPTANVNSQSPGGGLSGNGGISSPEEKKPRRSGSIKFKGLRSQMSAKNLNVMWKHGNDSMINNSTLASPPLPLASTVGGKDNVTVGLFKNGLPIPPESESTFTGLRENGFRSVSSPSSIPTLSSTSNMTDFGPPLSTPHEDPSNPTNSVGNGSGSGSGKGKFASRIFGFGRNHTKSSKRNPSIDGSSSIKISDPITSSLVHSTSFESQSQSQSQSQTQHISLGHGRDPSHHAIPPPPIPPASQSTVGTDNPASPRSIKRKPVPGSHPNPSNNDHNDNLVKNSMSLNSMNSFVLEDAPKGRRGNGNVMLGQAQ